MSDRLLFKKVSRRIVCCLWALVALRLVCPFSIESRLSLIPDGKFEDVEVWTENQLDEIN